MDHTKLLDQSVRNHPCFSECLAFEDVAELGNRIEALFADQLINHLGRFDMQVELLVAIRQYQIDFDENTEKLKQRLLKFDEMLNEKLKQHL